MARLFKRRIRTASGALPPYHVILLVRRYNTTDFALSMAPRESRDKDENEVNNKAIQQQLQVKIALKEIYFRFPAIQNKFHL